MLCAKRSRLFFVGKGLGHKVAAQIFPCDTQYLLRIFIFLCIRTQMTRIIHTNMYTYVNITGLWRVLTSYALNTSTIRKRSYPQRNKHKIHIYK